MVSCPSPASLERNQGNSGVGLGQGPFNRSVVVDECPSQEVGSYRWGDSGFDGSMMFGRLDGTVGHELDRGVEAVNGAGRDRLKLWTIER